MIQLSDAPDSMSSLDAPEDALAMTWSEAPAGL
jgi:hypothetical protein